MEVFTLIDRLGPDPAVTVLDNRLPKPSKPYCWPQPLPPVPRP